MNISITDYHTKHRDFLLFILAVTAPPGSAHDVETFMRWFDAGMYGDYTYRDRWFMQVLVPATEVWWAGVRDMPITADNLLLHVQDDGWRGRIREWLGRKK